MKIRIKVHTTFGIFSGKYHELSQEQLDKLILEIKTTPELHLTGEMNEIQIISRKILNNSVIVIEKKES